ncbi:flagellar biosynthesis anti-sigma factor FlgM [Treponema phagedenis]|uniref:Flagellar biosynthesis anti-sigma factor FlgM n=1 Tax=Treponema phagedenis TaxID=162 RepID=A0A0B7GVV8_TREPH|nr:flagellar biosynthesis anti-sigma factor FlgM [Treponema phagedenis]NVP25456.1 flagellar biosynthesis anti-sigma factor FlgM [Treponema phagedenis]QEJ93935.1 flagellar biosynthesis anti-sigma factor FlgM [Treponema phagedenis]QEJ96742.1 flagellar biosynthesis anti-sigma factor FlgM [Treponema phagedenis]QEJ96813.1 flagellar biosynthesis anti-sigma factor FlgM [Treponema phagedenis]QEJ96902.1 flagellar biosynthesis anti-sigma factor FlgM [Treponema phagedenis]
MMIDKLGGIDPLKNLQNTQKTRQAEKPMESDSISVSKEAQIKSEIYLAMQSVRAAPEIREDKIAEVEKKLADPEYINKVLDSAADKIIEAYGF